MLLLTNAFLIGILGSPHCMGMCGSIACALGASVRPNTPRRTSIFLLQLMLSFGRIISYALAGLIVGSIGFSLVRLLGPRAGLIAHAISALIMIALGLYVAGFWYGLNVLERAGARVWSKLSKLTKYLLPIDTWYKALTFGLLWGGIPCGLVYTTLIWALSVASWQQSMLLMLAFGLGTLPSILLVTVFATRFNKIVQSAMVRRIAGVIIIGFGLYMLVGSTGGGHPHVHMH